MTPPLRTRLRAALHRLRRRLRDRTYRLKEQIPEPVDCRVSVVVPTKNRADLLRAAIDGVLHHTDYPNLEIIVVDNGSDQPDALSLLEELRCTPRVVVVAHAGAFNFSALCNAGVRAATGDVLCFLNNDVRITQPGWLRELVSLALQPDVGAAGPLLLYPDGRMQHLGIRVGDGFPRLMGDGSDANAFRNSPASRQRREVDALTGACLVVSRTRFENIGGFDEQLAVAYNDVDLCLHLRSRGLRIVWTPFAEMVHELSASRGFARSDADRARHEQEWQHLRSKWPSAHSPTVVGSHCAPLDAAARIAAVVLNWNGRADTLACLASLQAQTARATIYMVDNGSIDGSVDAVRREFPDVAILENGANLGYAGGNNVGIRRALDDGADVIVILNNDTLLEPECIASLADALTPADVAAAAPKALVADDPRIVHFAGGGISGRGEPYHHGLGCADGPEFDAPHDTEWITGCAIAVRSSALERIGAFDERFFLLFEDADWSLRARRAGLRLRYCPTARIHHTGSISFGGKSSSTYQYFRTRNHLLWLEKHYPPPLRWKLAVHSIIDSWRCADRLSKTPVDRSRLGRATRLGILHYAVRRFGAGPF